MQCIIMEKHSNQIKAIFENLKADQMKKVNKQCLLDTPAQ